MKKIIQLIALLLAMLFVLTSCGTPSGTNDDTTADTATADTTLGDVVDTTTGGVEEQPETPVWENDTRWGSAMNLDGDAIYYFLNKYKDADGNYDVSELEEKATEWFYDRFAYCGISDMLYNISMTAPFASNDEDLYDKLDKYHTTVDNGKPVNYKNDAGLLVSHLVYETTNVDPYQVWFDLCRENGMNPWLSFRMNDVHYANENKGLSPFQYKAKANGWTIGAYRQSYWNTNECTAASRLWYAHALNYQIPQVRERFLKEIEDRLSTYDPYGIELDWHRQIWSFPTDSLDNIQYINLFMEEVVEIVEKYEEIYGHDIKISVRLNRDIDEAKYFGFDVEYWAEQGWIDVIIPGSYWGTSDSDIPVEEWVDALGEYGVDVWTSLEVHVMAPDHDHYHTVATLAAYTAQYLTRGAEKVYLYNMFNFKQQTIKACESLRTALFTTGKRSYVVTESNCTPYGVGFTEWDPLPIEMTAGKSYDDIVINHGILNYDRSSWIYVGLGDIAANKISKNTLKVTYNGVACEYGGPSGNSFVGNSTSYGYIIKFRIPDEAIKDSTSGQLVFKAMTNVTLVYVELQNGSNRVN